MIVSAAKVGTLKEVQFVSTVSEFHRRTRYVDIKVIRYRGNHPSTGSTIADDAVNIERSVASWRFYSKALLAFPIHSLGLPPSKPVICFDSDMKYVGFGSLVVELDRDLLYRLVIGAEKRQTATQSNRTHANSCRYKSPPLHLLRSFFPNYIFLRVVL